MHGAVIGSGVGSAAMAHALWRAGPAVESFERDPEPRSTGHQLEVPTNGMHAL